MARTINPHLFGQYDSTQVATQQESAQSVSLQKKMRELEGQIENLQQKMVGWLQVQEQKFQLLSQTQKSTSEQLSKLSEQFTQHQVIIQNKLNERRTSESRSQDLLDRHQQVVQNFEVRLNQLQKVAKDQEVKLMSYQASYDEILREIRSLRRTT